MPPAGIGPTAAANEPNTLAQPTKGRNNSELTDNGGELSNDEVTPPDAGSGGSYGALGLRDGEVEL